MSKVSKTRKRVTKVKEKKVTKVKKDDKPILADVISKIKIKGMDAGEFKRNISIVNKDNKLAEIPYYIPFNNVALNLETGGIIGGTFCEISAQSQSGKSFLAYELMATCQQMGGFVILNDGERAFEEAYGKIVGLDMEDGSFIYTTISDINKSFAFWEQAIRGIRKRKKKAPILIVQDSYPTMVTSMSLKNVGTGEALGYEAMQKNQAFSREMEKFVATLAETASTFILINQFTKNSNAGMYENPYTSLCEEKIQYFATQRLKGMLGPKLTKELTINGNKTKVMVGRKSTWETIKNRAVKPFQKCTVAIKYSTGIAKYSGLVKLLVETEVFRTGTRKVVNGETFEKAQDVIILNEKFCDEEVAYLYNKKANDIVYIDDIEDFIERFPAVLKPIKTGEYDDDSYKEGERRMVEVYDVDDTEETPEKEV